MMNSRRILTSAVGAVAVAAMLIGGAPGASADGSTVTRASGPTYLYGANNPLAGVHIRIRGVQTHNGKTIVRLRATGFDPSLAGRTFGAHVHVNPCGAEAAAAGGHYKNVNLPASDVEAREIWLDFTVGPGGNASVRAERPWVFTSSAQSVVVHAAHTDPATGGAGARLACTSAAFHA